MTRGVVALGDSITRGRGGTPALGVHFQSWAQWLAEALALPFTNLAADGATVADVLAGQVPRLAGPYDLGLLFVGVNDARSLAWDAAAYERDVRAVANALHGACARVAVLTLPEDLGRPSCAPKPAQANAALRRLDDIELVELADFGGPRVVLPDAIHPTAPGMVAIARRALTALAPGVEWSSDDAEGRQSSARWIWYGGWWGKLWVKDVVRRLRERRQYAAGR